MNNIASVFISLFQDMKLPIRWVAFMSLLTIVSLGFLGYEQLTGNFYLAKLDRKIALLKELQSIKDAGIDKHPELKSIYEHTSSELSSFEVHTAVSYIPSIQISDPTTLGKAISGAILWLVISILGVSVEIRKSGKVTGMIIGLGIFLFVIAAIAGWIGTLIPTIYNPWVNYILFPVIQFFILLLFTKRISKPVKV